MPKKKLTQIAEEQEVEFEEAMRIAQEKLPEGYLTGRGKNTWVNEDGAAILEDSFMIEEIIPKHFVGKVLSECPNGRYNYVYAKEIGKRVPVLIPSKSRGHMVGKVVTFEAIEDIRGISYRYVK